MSNWLHVQLNTSADVSEGGPQVKLQSIHSAELWSKMENDAHAHLVCWPIWATIQ